MQIRIRAHEVELSEGDRAAIDRGLRLALGARAADVRRARVALTPSRLGVHCRIRALLRNGETVVVEDHADLPRAAAAVAAWRLEHRLGRPRAHSWAEPRLRGLSSMQRRTS